MDLRQLAALVAVADHGTFSAAADALHTVQSNVSTHVARLERQLGVVLVDRAAGRLTPEGEAVAARARRVQAELDAVPADLAALRDEISGSVRLGVIGTTARWLVAHVFADLGARHPGIRLEILEASTTSLLPQLVGGRLDQAVVNLPVDDPDVAVDPLFDEDLLLVAPEDHPFAGRDTITVEELADVELLLPAPGTGLRLEADRAAAAAGIELRPQAEIDGIRLLASLAFQGFGPAVLPATAAPSWVEGPWRRVNVRGLRRRRVALAHRRRGVPSPPARALAELLHEVVASQVGVQPGIHPPGDQATDGRTAG